MTEYEVGPLGQAQISIVPQCASIAYLQNARDEDGVKGRVSDGRRPRALDAAGSFHGSAWSRTTAMIRAYCCATTLGRTIRLASRTSARTRTASGSACARADTTERARAGIS